MPLDHVTSFRYYTLFMQWKISLSIHDSHFFRTWEEDLNVKSFVFGGSAVMTGLSYN